MNTNNTAGHPVVQYFFDALPHFLGYFAGSILLAVVFLAAYVKLTPHREFELIKAGNSAVAVQLVGSFLGFAIPMAVVISHSFGPLDMALWGVTSLITQLVTFYVISKIFAGIESRIVDNCMSSGVLVGGVSLAVGILQAGCMVP